VALEQIEELRKLTLQELIDFFNEYVKVGAPRKRTLSVRVHGNLHSSEYKSEASEPQFARIDDIFSFRKSQSLYGSFKGLTGQMKL
jgi:insulysin